LVRPVTVTGLEVALVVNVDQVVNGDTEYCTVYVLTEGPPLAAGAVQETTDWVLALLVPATPVGTPGTTREMEDEAGE
jgi:hypothetical protein